MREHIQERLQELKQEFAAGKRAQAELDIKREELTRTMLRIHGAIQVLEELLVASQSADGDTGHQQLEEYQRKTQEYTEASPTTRRMVVG
jgi:hypothetical protein